MCKFLLYNGKKTKYSEILFVLAVALVCVKNVETRFDK